MDAVSSQQSAKPFQADGGDDLLTHKILLQLAQGPLRHADERLGRGEGDCGDLFHDVGQEFARRIPLLPDWIPLDGPQSAAVESMNDLAHPLR